MQDTLKSFLVALVTSVVILFVLGPVMLKVHGFSPALVPAAAPAAGAPAVPGPPAPVAAQMTAPNIAGMLARDARERFRAQGITIIEDGERADPSAKPGTVLEQNPAAGAPLEQKEIRVLVARAPDPVLVPDVVGKAQDDARKILVEAGFEVPDAALEPGGEQAPGTVLRQEPNAGATTEQGALVRLFVAEDTVEVPGLRGKTITAARAALEKAGLSAGSVIEREDEELSGRRVISHTPGPGTRVARGTPVDLVIVAPD